MDRRPLPRQGRNDRNIRVAAKPNGQPEQIQLLSNLFPITLPRGIVYQYDAQVRPANQPMRERAHDQKYGRFGPPEINRKVMAQLADTYKEALHGSRLAYDGRKNAFSRRKLPDTMNKAVFKVSIVDNEQQREYDVTLRFACEVSLDTLHAMYEGQGSKDFFQPAITAADIILRTAPSLEFVSVGRSFFSNSESGMDLTGGREARTGFYSSVRPAAWKPLVNFDISTTAFYRSILVSDYAREVLGDRCQGPLLDRDRIELQRQLSGLKVTHIYLTSKRAYKIKGLSRYSASRERFEQNDRSITVAEYFAKKYNRTLQYPNLPCVMEEHLNMIPMELCMIVPGQHCRKKLSDIQTSNMIRSTAINPAARFQKIIAAAQNTRQIAKPYLDEFEMKIEATPVEVTGRILSPPRIAYTKSVAPVVPYDGVWRNMPFNAPAKLQRWALVVHGGRLNDMEAIIQTMVGESQRLGMKLTEPVYTRSFPSHISERQMLETVKDASDVDITMVVLGRSTNYSILKMEAETSDLEMRTQCVKEYNANKKFNNTFAENLLMKLNAKCGGQNWRILAEDRPHRLKRPFMIVGADVNHPAPGDNVTPSIAAIVASMDPGPSQYHATTSVQVKSLENNRIEHIVHLKAMFLECLKVFRETTGSLPEVVYFYRDGVSEGQLDGVRRQELTALRTACAELALAYQPLMTFIVVQKRHHVRFKPMDDRQGTRKSRNIPAGTVIDTEVVHPMLMDFYLCSHQGPIGTSVPAHYHVVHDDAGHSLEELERLSYFLCYTNARCTKSVSIPAPTYYAHLAAARAKDYVKAKVYGGSSSGGSDSSGGSGTTDIEEFAAAQRVCDSLKGQMYFV